MVNRHVGAESQSARRRTLRRMLVISSVVSCATLGAATIPVTTTTDVDLDDADCSLREAIVAANTDAGYHGCPAGAGADRIAFDLAFPATIALTADLPAATTSMKLQGPGRTQLALDGQDLHRILVLDSPGGLPWFYVERLTLTRGRAPGGVNGTGGGAFVGTQDKALFSRVRFLANTSANGGGGLGLSDSGSGGATVTLEECEFEGNVAEGALGGGGLYSYYSQVIVHGTTFSGNRATSATGVGGGIRQFQGRLTLEQSTLSANEADSGGGIYVSGNFAPAPMSLTIVDSTITQNVANADGNSTGDGGGVAAGGTAGLVVLALQNSVVAGNLDSGTDAFPDLFLASGILASLTTGFDFVGSRAGATSYFPAGSPNANGDWVGTAAAPLDPQLGILHDNGGPTSTHRPLTGVPSLLIDNGQCPNATTDQRGFGDALLRRRRVDSPAAPNPVGGDLCDIGAVEVDATADAGGALFSDGFELGHTLLWSDESR